MADRRSARQVGVLLGGMSAERAVSLRTGGAIARALRERGHAVVEIDVGRDLPDRLREAGVEVAVNALHGTYGEDGCVQGLLEVLGIPYTGCGVAASALTMDKVQTKRVLEMAAIPTPPWVLLRGSDGLDPAAVPWDPPLVVKPVSEGSSVGITMVDDLGSLPAALAEAARHGGDVLVERRIVGPEVTVGVLDGRALGTVEIRPRSGWYDYRNKYTAGATEYFCPARVPDATLGELAALAEAAAAVTGCEGAVRVDFMLGAGRPFVIEINTIPGMTETSLLPKAAAAAGIPFDALCLRIAETSWKLGNRR